MTPAQLGWVAGLLEGEGSFMVVTTHGQSRPRVSMQSTDLDVLERLEAVTGVGHICDVGVRNGRKFCWQWAAGAIEDAFWLMDCVYPLMGARRQGQIDTARAKAGRERAYPAHARRPALGQPDLVLAGYVARLGIDEVKSLGGRG
jgi:hypothetical protein